MIATQHDSITTEVPVSEAAKYKKVVPQYMRDVSAQFLGKPIRVEVEEYKHGDRFKIKKGEDSWRRIQKILRKYK